jgi:dTDP-4-amino-4,6-dideoxygalactose transaminase
VPVHRQPYIQELGLHAELPVTDRAAAETVALPIFPGLTDEEQATVIEAVRSSVLSRAAAGTIGRARP